MPDSPIAGLAKESGPVGDAETLPDVAEAEVVASLADGESLHDLCIRAIS